MKESTDMVYVYDKSEGIFYDSPSGVLYNADKTKLVKAPSDITEYSVLSSTKVICDRAFEGILSGARRHRPRAMRSRRNGRSGAMTPRCRR